MRRTMLLSLTAAGIFASAATAQEQPAPPPPAPMAPMAAPAAPMAPMAPMMPAPPAPPPVPEAPPPPPPPPPPAPPTDIASLAVLNVIERVCDPLVRGGDLATLAKPLGFKKKRDQWIWKYDKGYQIVLLPLGTNPEVCTMDVDHPVEAIAPAATLATDLHNWAQARGWYLARFDKYVTDMERTTRSWEYEGDQEQDALVLMTARKVGGGSQLRNADRTQVLYAVRKN
ncbi:MAG: hypothetical protein Q8L66_04535 [Caulobacter sp.]|nr:hypothetical protein [Caulobacter sp.]